MVDFSVIIPVYNVEKYLTRCVNSVLSQTGATYEVLLVDDASTDGSGALCDGFAKADDRVRVIRNERNLYVGAARNIGFKASGGRYVYFLDADDEMCDGVLSYVKEFFSDSLIPPDIIASFVHCTKKPNGKIKAHSVKSIKLPLPTQINVFSPFVGQNFYLREFLEYNEAPFDERRMLAEDRKWLMENVRFADTVAVADRPFYYYTMRREGSLLSSIRADCLEYSLSQMKELFDGLPSLGYGEYAPLKRKIADHYLTIAACCAIVKDDALRKKLMADVEKGTYILKDRACLAHPFMWIRKITGLTFLLKMCNAVFLRYKADK